MIDLVQPLVGRDREPEGLGHPLGEVRAGSQRSVFVTAEPGIGKTRLLLEPAVHHIDTPTRRESRTRPQIAGGPFVSIKTIGTHRRRIFRKLGVFSRQPAERADARDAG